MKEYTIDIAGLPHTVLLDEAEAQRIGARPVETIEPVEPVEPVEVKQAPAPANKAAPAPANKKGRSSWSLTRSSQPHS